MRDVLELTQRDEVISFAGGLPAPELFPAELVAHAFAAALAPTRAARALQYSSTEGDPELRALLAQRFTLRGLEADLCFGFAGAKLVPVACDEQGRDPEAVPQLVAEHRPQFLYLVPTFQNPTGRTMPAQRRRRLAEIAAEHGLWLVEDEPYGDLRYDGDPLAPIGSHAAARDRTVTITSLSKVLAPGLRIGFPRAPKALMGPLAIAKQAADLHTSTVDQLAARASVQAADLDEHIATPCGEYRRRRDALLHGLAGALPEGSTFNRPDGGMFVWARLPEGHDAADLLAAALRHDVAFVPGAPFSATQPDHRTLRLSFTTHVPDEIVEGLARLRTAARDRR